MIYFQNVNLDGALFSTLTPKQGAAADRPMSRLADLLRTHNHGGNMPTL